LKDRASPLLCMDTMKTLNKTLYILVFLLSASLAACGQQGPRITPFNEPWDFEKVEKGKVKEKAFHIENTGDRDLVIEKVNSCCGYTVLDVSSWKLAPGEKATLKLSVDPARKEPGRDRKEITILSNDVSSPSLEIPITAFIAAPPKKIDEKTSAIAAEKPSERSPGKALPAAGDTYASAIPSISPAELEDLMQKEDDLVILDVRETNEFSEKHIPEAVSFPISAFAASGELPLDAVSGASTIAVYCGGGFRSSYIAVKLKEAGHNAYNLEDGLESWEEAGFELTRGPELPSSEEPLTIGLEEAYELYYLAFGNKVVWIDLRDPDIYDMGHIKGAVNIPIYLFEKEMDTLPRDKQLVLYCSGPSCTKGTSAGRTLIKAGFEKGQIRVLTAGYNSWEAAGYPSERTEKP